MVAETYLLPAASNQPSANSEDLKDKSVPCEPSSACSNAPEWWDERTLMHVVDIDKRGLSCLRRKASRIDVRVRVSRRRIQPSVNHGGVRLIAAQDTVIAGRDFDLTVSEAEAALAAIQAAR